jgi:hypothetical protein
MTLKEVFERFGPETWANHLDSDATILLLGEVSDNSEIAGFDWVKHLLGIYSGRISYREIFEAKLTCGSLSEAFELLAYLDEAEKFSSHNRLVRKLKANHLRASEKVKELHQRIAHIEKKNLPETDQKLLEEIKTRLTVIPKASFREDVSQPKIQAIDRYIAEVAELEDWIQVIEVEVTSRERKLFDQAFDLFEAILKKLRVHLVDSVSNETKSIIQCFCNLPNLVVVGRVDLLSKISEIVSTGHIEELQTMEFRGGRRVQQFSPGDIRALIKKQSRIHKGIPQKTFRSTTELFLNRLSVLEKEFQSSDEARRFIEEHVENSETSEEAAACLLQGAKTLLSMGDQNVGDLQAKGLAELAEDQLLKRKYNYAFDLFADSFTTWVSNSGEFDAVSLETRKAATGMILAHWAPRRIVQEQQLEIAGITKGIFDEPAVMLQALADRGDFDILFHCFDQITGFAELRVFLQHLEDSAPGIEWVSILLKRTLQPRLFFQKPLVGVRQLQSLLHGRLKGIKVEELIQKLGTVIDTSYPDQNPSSSSIGELETMMEEVARQSGAASDLDSALLSVFQDGMSTIIRSLRNKVLVANELQFTARLENTVYFPEEQCQDLEIIVSFTLAETSLPAKFVSAIARIDEKQKEKFAPYVSLVKRKSEIGAVEPGTTQMLRFSMNINPKILQEYAEFPLELNFFDGVTAVSPTDKKRIFRLSLRGKRRGFSANPYITGPAIEAGGLYVGRQKELDGIKKALIGQSQDNIPLVLGIRRIGKTSLLKRLIADHEIKRKYIPIFYDLQDMPQSETTSDFLKKLCSSIKRACGTKLEVTFSRKAFDEYPFEAFHEFIEALDALKGTIRILVVFDEFEKLISNLRKSLERYREAEAPPDPREALIPEVFGTLRKAMLHSQRISFIVAGLPSIKMSFEDYEARWFGLMTPVFIKPLVESEAKDLIHPEGIPYDVSREATDEIIYMTGCQPYLIQLVCKDLFIEMSECGRQTATKLDVERVIERDILPNEEYFVDYKRLMGEDSIILRAIALCHKKAGRTRRYATINQISEVLAGFGNQLPATVLTDKLGKMQQAERPLVQRSPSRSDAYRIVIGMFSRILEEEIA